MKKGRNKTVYFRKDWSLTKPTTSQTKSHATSTKVAHTVKAIATKVQKATVKTAKSLSKSAQKFSRSLRNKSRSHRKATKRSPFSWREVTLMSLIGTSALMIAFSFMFTSLFDPIKRSERELTKLANNYYIEYLYPRALGKYLDQPKLILDNYTESGLPTVRLNQLLSYDSTKNANSFATFSNDYYQCDTNATTVRYYPVEPYGPKDFTVEYQMSCEKTNDTSNHI